MATSPGGGAPVPPSRRLASAGRLGLRLLDRATDTLALTALVTMVLVVSWQVFGRFVLKDSPRWAPELALVLLGWVGFLGIAIGIREQSHIAVAYFADKLPRAAAAVVDRLGPLLMLGFGGYLVIQGWEFTTLMANNTMPGTGLPRSLQYAAMPISGVLVALYASLQLLGLSTKRHGAEERTPGTAEEVGGSVS